MFFTNSLIVYPVKKNPAVWQEFISYFLCNGGSNLLEVFLGVIFFMCFPDCPEAVAFPISWNEVHMVMEYGLAGNLAVIVQYIEPIRLKCRF